MSIEQALQGVKVIDLAWALTGPIATKCLADFGATVVKVESSAKLDICRVSGPYHGGKPDIDTPPHFLFYNTSKYSMALNLKHPKGLLVLKKLIRWADVMVESFTPKVLEKWGLEYKALKCINPNIIVIRASVQGQEGPQAQAVSYGPILTGLAGFYSTVGWPDRLPSTTGEPYTDWVAPWYVAAATLAALDYRKRTGKGQQIDLSQLEAAASFLSPAILDYVINGRIKGREGNRCSYAAPHGAYRCQGHDRWCVIAVTSDDEWEAFCNVIGNSEWTRNAEFATLEARKKNEDELNKLVEEWTSSFSAEEVMNLMQAAGIPAGVVENSRDLVEDHQLNHRGFLVRLNHQKIGPNALHESLSFRLSKTPHQLRAAPTLGRDTEYVCSELLGMPTEEFIELFNEGVFK